MGLHLRARIVPRKEEHKRTKMRFALMTTHISTSTKPARTAFGSSIAKDASAGSLMGR